MLRVLAVDVEVPALEELAYPSGLPGKTVPAMRASTAKAGVSVGRTGPRRDYRPRGDEYDESHQRARVRQGKPRNTPTPKPRRRPAAKRTPTPVQAPDSIADMPAPDADTPVSPGVGPIED